MTDILIVNASPVLLDGEVSSIIPALQKWDDDYLRPAYGFDRCTYHFMPRGQLPDPNDASVWPIFLNRHSVDPGALGWHDDDSGRVFGRVFVGDCLRYGVSWTVDLSHEAAEMRGDPHVDQKFVMPDGRISMVELCDAVEADELAITVDGVRFSDFVLPDYWSAKTSGKFDYQGALTGPCPTLTPGGYMSIWDGRGWTQHTAMFLGGPPSYRSIRFHQSHRRRRMTAP